MRRRAQSPVPPYLISGKTAFTLIELLVVVAIIALLVAILLPALGRARIISRDTVCKSNARQVAVGLLEYATSWGNYLPPAVENADLAMDPTGNSFPTWHLRVWDFVMNRPYIGADLLTPYSYLSHTVFECPQAAYKSPFYPLSGYNDNDHRQNGFGLNVSTPGSLATFTSANASNDEIIRSKESKLITLIRNPSQTLLVTDAQGFYVEYFDRGASLNQIGVAGSDASNAGKMLNAVARHGINHDTWNMAFFDGSAHPMQFKDVPSTPSGYYNINNEQTPLKLFALPDVPADTKNFWLGQMP